MATPAPAAGHSTAPASEREPWLATLLRMVVHAVAAAVLAWPLTHPQAVFFAGVGATAGALLGGVLARTRLRLIVILLIALGILALAALVSGVLVGSDLLAPSLGPARTMIAGDAALFGIGALAVSTGLRACSARYRWLSVLEAAAVAIAAAQLVVAHRQGAINRPFEVADPIIAQGGDPTLAFLILGTAAAAVIVVLLLHERSVLRAAVHLVVVAGILILVLGTTQMAGLPPPPPGAGGLGLRPDERQNGQSSDRRPDGHRDNEQLDFRDNYSSSANQAPLAVVLFHDDYSPPTGVYYFRQGAFSQFNGRRLVRATRGGVDRDIATGFPTLGMDVDEPPPDGSPRVSLETSVALLADHMRPFGLEAPVRFEATTNPDTVRFRRTYRVTSEALDTDLIGLIGIPLGDPSWSPDILHHYTEAPSDPRYGALAHRIVEEQLPEDLRGLDMARAMAITVWLGREGKYSMRSRHAGATDPTADFLFGDLTGYCVHFAHAAVYLMRELGIPSRVATGYAVDESARQGGSALLLTGSAAHAWPEVYVQGVGWVVLDVAPETILDPPGPPPDPDLQRLLGELARGQTLLTPDRPPEPVQVLEAARDAGATFLAWAARVGLVALALLFAVKLWRRLVPRLAPAGKLPRLLYRAELDRLSELSIRRHRGESREAFASRVAGVAPSFARLTREHVGTAFGSRRAGRDRDRLVDAARAVRTEVRGAIPFRRRALGVITPWSWLTSR